MIYFIYMYILKFKFFIGDSDSTKYITYLKVN